LCLVLCTLFALLSLFTLQTMPGTEDKEQSTKNKAQSTKMQVRQRTWIAYALLLLTAFSFRFSVAMFLPNDVPGDARVYSQMARNMLEQHVYSHAKAPPYQPSLIRLPGYSIFLAALYSVFGHWNNTAVRIVQALLDTLTCVLVALIAYRWEPDEKRKRAASLGALALAAICPFTTIYVATVLTETWASLFAVALCLLATMAFTSTRDSQPGGSAGVGASFKRSLWWWAAAGLLAGASVFFRPDSGLFVAAVGLTLVISAMIWQRNARQTQTLRSRLVRCMAQGAVLSATFAVVLVPWTVRNWREFHLFQPLAPTHGEMPGEFVQFGYFSWLRTWVDDRKYTEPMLWSMDESEIDVDELPATAFDSAEEKERVRKLFDQYNDPPDEDADQQTDQPQAEADPSPTPAREPSKTTSSATAPTPSPETADKDQAAQENKSEPEAPTEEPPPEMTPALDAAFGQIASERIARAPLRYYLLLPLKRARSLWFGPHADYYPFAGELFPLEDLDHNTHQHIWLPLFELLVWIYTLLGVLGGWRLWRSPEFASRRWLMLAVLMIFLRLGFFSTKENPEPRYTVEIFPFLAILGGIAIARLRKFRET
jgi:hypothetical protein